MPLPLRSCLFSGLFLLLVSGGTAAAEEPPVVKALLDSAALNTVARPTYSSVEVAADGTIRVKGVAMTLKGAASEQEAARYEIEELALSGVSERAPGKFEVREANWTGLTIRFGDMAAAAFPVVNGRNAYINQISPNPSDLERLQSANVRAREFTIPEGLVLIGGKSIVIERVHNTWDGDPDTGAGVTHFEVASIRAPGEVFAPGGDGNPLAEIGYQSLELNLVAKGLTTIAGNDTGFDFEVKINGKEMGAITLNLAADGIPASVFTAFAAGEPKLDTLEQDAQGMLLRRVKIRFEDASATTRLLALAARMQGTDVETLIKGLTEGAQAAIAGMGAPALAGDTASAIRTFLNDPRSITLSLSPEQPVKGAEIMQAMQDPTALIRLLALKLTAND